MNKDDIRKGLRNIRTRSAIITAVEQEGPCMNETIITLLNDRNEGVRWSAIKILSEIGDAQAIAPLISLLEQNKNATTAAMTLRAITGKDFGDDPNEWRDWAAKDDSIRNSGGLDLSDEDLISAAVEGLPVMVSGSGEAYTITVTLPDQRNQQVWINLSAKTPEGKPIVQLSTPCGDADKTQYENVLKMNMSIPFGCLALAEMDGKLVFAMTDSYIRKTAHPQDIAESIMSLAKNGDSMEKSLSQADRY